MKRNAYIAIILTIFLLTGCSKEAEEIPRDDKTIQINIMHYFGDTDTDESAKCFKEIIENEFEEAFPNVQLVQSIYDNGTYKKKIKVLMASGEVPDIMFGYGGGFSQAYVDSGKLLNLDDYINEDYRNRMDMQMQENFIYDGKQYGICFSYWTGVLYCNMGLFEQAGVEIPKTYEELKEVSKILRKNNIQPVACGMLDRWHGQQWINNYTIQLAGAEFYKKMASGEESLDNEILIRSADLVQGLIRAEVFCDDIYNMTSSEAEEMFLEGDAAMIYIGNWYTSSAKERLGDKLAVTQMPVVPGAGFPNDYHGGGINGWMVSADTKYPELATEIAQWLAYRISCYQPQTSTFKIKEGDQVGNIDRINQDILDMYKDKENGGCAWDSIMLPEDADIWLDLCGKLFNMKFNGKGFAKLLKSQIDWRRDI
uniref:ABC transporter substrate-binding protein n=1 Tax=Enterocloster aldenensis TaxID=358742 RepID=UPI002E79539C